MENIIQIKINDTEIKIHHKGELNEDVLNKIFTRLANGYINSINPK